MTTQLIVITGPIASGKTSTAEALAAWARNHGMTAVAIDTDVMVEMAMGPLRTAWTLAHFRTGVQIAAAAIDRLTELDADHIVLAGPFFRLADRTLLLAALRTSPAIHFVTLRTTLEETLRRCEADPTRVVTKDPAFVERIYAEIDWNAVPGSDIVIDSEAFGLDGVVATIVSRLRLLADDP